MQKTLTLEKIEKKREVTEDEMVNGIIDTMDMSLSKFQEIVKDSKFWSAAVHGGTKNWTRLSDWTTNSDHHEVILHCSFGFP